MEQYPISLVISGYANALYHLGARYELGRGAFRNIDEATRCYMKAAKLGNLGARARLHQSDDSVDPQ